MHVTCKSYRVVARHRRRIRDGRLLFEAPELAEKLLECGLKLEVRMGSRLVRPELR
jgi:hypothetical protein